MNTETSAALHVLHLAFEDPLMPGAGGGSLRTLEINRRLAAQDIVVSVVTTRYPGCVDGVREGVLYRHAGIGRGRNRLTRLLGYMVALPAVVVGNRDADLIVEDFFPPFSSMAVPLWTNRPVVGMVQWLHAREKARQYKLPFGLLERLTVRTHRRLIAVSADTAFRLTTMNPRAHVTVIGNGIDAALLDLPARLGDDILFLGRLELDGKGLDLLLHAWATAARRVDATLVIAGTGPDDARARRLADQLGVADRVRFVGWVSGTEKRRLLSESRLLVLPSRAETFGIVAVEALAAATPVLAFDLPALQEVVPPGSGWLVPAFDVSALADRIVAVYDDEESILDAGRRGRAIAAAFDWTVLAREQADAYRAAVADHRARHGSSSLLRSA